MIQLLSEYITPGMLLLFGFSAIGLLAHFVTKRLQGNITVSLWHYLRDAPGYTIATIISLLAADAALVAIGQLEDIKPHVLASLGFTTGWTLDSAITAPRHHDDDDHDAHGEEDHVH